MERKTLIVLRDINRIAWGIAPLLWALMLLENSPQEADINRDEAAFWCWQDRNLGEVCEVIQAAKTPL